MRKREIERKFDDIVGFAEVEKFLDTPVKRYSSGMYVRLAFAVAAHLEPEILLVDEVLSVGDIAFQKKCLGKMEDVAKGGRTVLFVSHNMGAIRSLCQSAVWLDSGMITKIGPVGEVVAEYEENQLRDLDEHANIVDRRPDEVVDKSFYISQTEVMNENGQHTGTFKYNDKLVLLVHLAGQPTVENYNVIFQVYNEMGYYVCAGAAAEYHGQYFSRKVKKVGIKIGPLILTSGKYRVALTIRKGGALADTFDVWENAAAFSITECHPFETSWEMLVFRDGSCVVSHLFYEVE